MSSLQAAFLRSGDTSHQSQSRYSTSGRTTPIPRTTHQIHRSITTSTTFGSCDWALNSTQAQPSQTVRQDNVNSSPSAFSSLHRAAAQAGLVFSKDATITRSSQVHLNSQVQRGEVLGYMNQPQEEVHSTRCVSFPSKNDNDTHGNDNPIITSHREDDDDDELGVFWNPPIREAVFSSSHALPAFSPLPVRSIQNTPTSHIQGDYGLIETQPNVFNTPSSQPRGQSVNSYAFVPIQEGVEENVEVDRKPMLGNHFNSRNIESPVKLSSTSKSWKPETYVLKYNSGGIENNLEDNAYDISSYHRNEAMTSRLSSSMTPTKGFSSDCNKKYSNQYGTLLAPSPTFTVETAEMTIDTPSVTESHNSFNTSTTYQGKSNNLLSAIGAPPIYSSITQPLNSNLHRNVSFNSDTGATNLYKSSMGTSAPIERNQVYQEGRPNATGFNYPYEKTGDYSQQYYYYEANQQGQLRSQSAPTLGRPTFNALSKNDDDTQQRKCRVKTELCMHYENGRPCPFGANCTYAHGEEELQMTKLIDLHEAGLVDMATYRTKPCLTWVATGSCPFGKRCACIHDYRVGSSASHSWLPHTETQGNTIATDINVDGLHQKRLHTILYDNPFGDQFTLSSSTPNGNCSNTGRSTWEDLYRLVCDEDIASESGGRGAKFQRCGWIAGSNKRGGRQVHPIYKLQIALKLRGTDPDWQYKYRPQHVVHDELCMVLQKRAFRITLNENNSKNDSNKAVASAASSISSVAEIPLFSYNPRSANHILVHEIAFGPDSDPTIRGVALWFNIADEDVTVCTPQQAKRFRWKKNGVNPAVTSSVVDKKVGVVPTKPSIFDSGTIERFLMIRPHDDAAFNLVTDILRFRLSVLKRERMSNMKERFEALEKLKKQELWLKERFENQRRSWLQWAWPVNCGREYVDDNTPVPPVEGPYLVKSKDAGNSNSMEALNGNKDTAVDSDAVGGKAYGLWDSFVNTIVEDTEYDVHREVSENKHQTKRLSIFDTLSQGISLSDDGWLPHIIKDRAFSDDDNKGHVVVMDNSMQQERCWKALLLQPTTMFEANEWEIVREHFENSRSKKVLSIIQQ